MYKDIKQNSRRAEYRHVVIKEVNPVEMLIIGETNTGDQIEINFSFHGPIVAIPMPGELWSIKREVDWQLEKRIDKEGTVLYPIKTLKPGDRRFEARGKIYIKGEDVIINGKFFSQLLTEHIALQAAVLNLQTRVTALETP